VGRHATIVPILLLVFALPATGGEPPSTVPDLVRALGDRDRDSRLNAAQTLRALGPAAAAALDDLSLAARGDPEPAVRAEAAWAVMALGPAAAETVGEWLLPHGDRSRVEELIGRVGPAARPMLAELTGHRAWFVRRSALRLLGTLGPDATPVAATILGRLADPSSAVRTEALLAFQRCGATGGDAFVAVAPLREDESPVLRRGAVAVIGGLEGPPDKRRAFLLRAVREGEDVCRHLALIALRARGAGDEVTGEFRRALGDPDMEIRTLAATALVERDARDDVVVGALREIVSERPLLDELPVKPRRPAARRTLRASRGPWYPAPVEKSEIVAAVAALGEQALPMLREALAASARDVRANAIWILARMPNTQDLIAPRLDDPDPGVRVIAAVALAPRPEHAARALPVLLSVLSGGRLRDTELAWGWHRRVAEAVVSLGPDAATRVLRLLREHVEQGRDLDAEHYVLVRMLGPKAAPAVPTLARSWRRSLRLGFLHRAQKEALRAIGEAARPEIEKLLADEAGDLHDVALAMLAVLDRKETPRER
jgi:HEAT repeat protein